VYDDENGDLYVAQYSSNNLTVVSGSTNTVIATVELEGGDITSGPPVYDSGNGDLYIAMAESHLSRTLFSQNVSVVSGSTNTLLGTIEVGYEPIPPAYDPSNGDLYVPDVFPALYPDNISVIGTVSSAGGAQTFLGLPALQGYAVVGGVIAVAVIVGGVLALRSSRRKRRSMGHPPQSTSPPTGSA
jgi:YVTN family beta-propeller protein